MEGSADDNSFEKTQANGESICCSKEENCYYLHCCILCQWLWYEMLLLLLLSYLLCFTANREISFADHFHIIMKLNYVSTLYLECSCYQPIWHSYHFINNIMNQLIRKQFAGPFNIGLTNPPSIQYKGGEHSQHSSSSSSFESTSSKDFSSLHTDLEYSSWTIL